MLDRPKDWLDVEEIRAWLRRLAPDRLAVFETSAMPR
jgi:DNA primase catalytic subunit